MKFNPLIMIMHVRNIEKCLSGFDLLQYDKLWINYHTEGEIEKAFPKVLQEIKALNIYSHLSIISDDGYIEKDCVENIYAFAEKYPVVCGWCNIDAVSPFSNISKSKLTIEVPTKNCIDLYTIKEVEDYKTEEIKTWFSGFSFHTMSIELWEEFPFGCYRKPNGITLASDYHLCYRLQQKNIPIVAVKSGRFLHMRKKVVLHQGIVKQSNHVILVGVKPKSIILERRDNGLFKIV